MIRRSRRSGAAQHSLIRIRTRPSPRAMPKSGERDEAAFWKSNIDRGILMALPKPPFNGSCLCGSVRVSIAAPPMLTLICHCRDCQKLTASAYSLTTRFPEDSFSRTGNFIVGGLKFIGHVHHFCKSCLNFIYPEIGEENRRINLSTSILDEAAFFEPFVELMSDHKMPWVSISAARSFSSYPENRRELHALMDDYSML